MRIRMLLPLALAALTGCAVYTPIGHAPMPPFPASWPMNARKVERPQMIHENTCGLIAPRRIRRMYGT